MLSGHTISPHGRVTNFIRRQQTPKLTCITRDTSWENISKSLMSEGIPPVSERWANIASRSMRAIMMFLTLTDSWTSAHDFRNVFRVARWNSSGKTCVYVWVFMYICVRVRSDSGKNNNYMSEYVWVCEHATEMTSGSYRSLEHVLSRGLHWEPQLTILAFSVNDPLPDLPKFLRNG